MNNLEDVIRSYSVTSVGIASVVLFLLAFFALTQKKIKENGKRILFVLMIVAIVFPTAFMSASTIYLNMVSDSGGPVHWHSDIEIWKCGEEINLKDPKGLSNKIGTSTLHEHNDKRIHLEGVVVEKHDASLGKFFNVINGEITKTSVRFPINEGVVSMQTGEMCPQGYPGTLQVFVYKVEYGKYYQFKVEDPASYIMAPHQNIPPGDCVIVEFGEEKTKTERICRSFKVAEQIGKIQKGE